MISKSDMQTFNERHRVLLQARDFICLRPHPGLSDYISNCNITFPTIGTFPASFTEMPCGCATLIIEQNDKNLRIYLDGPTTVPVVVGHSSLARMIITIEFKPAGLYALTGINQAELIDKTIPLEAVDYKLCKLLAQTVEGAKSICELMAGIDMLLIEKLENMYTTHHPQLRLVMENILSCGGDTTVKMLSGDIHYSERQLNRIFNQHVGMGTKAFLRLVRVNRSFRLLKKPGSSLTLASDIMGFHDLSHFLRDFKLVCGITPQEFRQNMSDFYTNPTKL